MGKINASDKIMFENQKKKRKYGSKLCSDTLYQYAYIRSPTTTDQQRLNFSCSESASLAQR